MRLFHRSEHPPIGLELAAGSIRLLQAIPGDEGADTVLLASRAAPHSLRAIAEQTREMLSDGGFIGRRIIAAIPDDQVQIRTLRITAPTNVLPPDELVQREAATAMGFDPATARFQYLYAGRVRVGPESRHELIAAACSGDWLQRFALELDRVGLRLVAADIAPCAVYRGIAALRMDSNSVCAVLEMGPDKTRVIIGEGSRIRFLKSIAQGTNQLREEVGRRLGITPEEAGQLRRRLIETETTASPEREPVRKAVRQACRAILESLAGEVVLCLRYHRVAFGGAQPDRLTLVGADAGDPQINSIFCSVAGIEAVPARPLAGLDVSRISPDDRDPLMSDWALPLGLAMKFRQAAISTSDSTQSLAA